MAITNTEQGLKIERLTPNCRQRCGATGILINFQYQYNPLQKMDNFFIVKCTTIMQPSHSIHRYFLKRNESIYSHRLIRKVSRSFMCYNSNLETSQMSFVQLLSRVHLFVTPWTVAFQAPLSMGFSCKNTGVCCHFLLQEMSITR